MANRPGRRRKQTITLAAHDRRSNDLLRNADVAAVVVEDPYDAGDKIVAMRSLRNDPLAKMHARKQIDDAQYEGGRAWELDYEILEISARAIDPTKEAVDGGKMMEMFTDRKRRAAENLALCRERLGVMQEGILRSILTQGKMPFEVANDLGFFGDLQVAHISWLFRQCLNTLAVVYGFASCSEK